MYNAQKIIKIKFNYCYIMKLSFPALLIILFILEFTFNEMVWELRIKLDNLFLISYIFLCWSLCLVMTQTEIRRRTMHPVCPLVFIFWFTLTVAYLIRFYSNCIRPLPDKHDVSSKIIMGLRVLSGVIFAIVIVCLVLDCISNYPDNEIMLGDKIKCPEEYASVLSKLTYSWLDKYIYNWYKQDMTDETTFNLRKKDESKANTDLVEKVFKKKLNQNKRKRTSERYVPEKLLSSESQTVYPDKMKPAFILFSSIYHLYVFKLMFAWLLKIIGDIFKLTMPILLRVLFKFYNNKNNSDWNGYGLAVAFLLFGILSSLSENMCYFITSGIGIRTRSTIIEMVYRKSLRLNNEVRNEYNSGELVNLMGVDADRVMNLVDWSWFFLSCPFQIIIIIILLYQEMNYAIFVGVGLLFAFLPLIGLVMKFMQRHSEIELKWKDKRLNLITEIMNGIKVLKMYGWEKAFISKVTQLRNVEMKYMLKISISWSIIGLTWELLPFLIMFFTFITYTFMDRRNVITAERAFVSFVLFNFLRYPMLILPWGFTQALYAYISLKRIGDYLIAEEVNNSNVEYTNNLSEELSKSDIAVEVHNGSFAWKRNEKIILNKIELQILSGKLVAIVGKIGTGKSSLVSAILGEMYKISGSVKIKGTIAYVPQEAWIQNMSLRENILFTKTYNETHYNNVIDACSLLEDFEQLPARDETEIGERGINLSGGQKQRINLARSVYQTRDIYLLDDPLSALDAHVGQDIFQKVISNNGILQKKTRILVTHGLHWLSKVDEVFVLDSNGSISERGTFKNLLKNGNQFMQFVEENMKKNKSNSNNFKDYISERTNETTNKLLRNLVREKRNSKEFIQTTTNNTFKRSPINYQKLEPPNGMRVSRVSKSDDLVSLKFNHSEQGINNLFPRQTYSDKDSFNEAQQRKKEYKKEDSNDIIKRISMSQKRALFNDELIMSGTVNRKSYFMYIKFRGLLLSIFTLIMFMAFSGLQVFLNIWLKKFTSDEIIKSASLRMKTNSSYIPEMLKLIEERTEYYLFRYGYIGLTMIFALNLFWFGFIIGSFRASKSIHQNLLFTILRSPMQFFGTTPSGRIMNRFSIDMDTIDHKLPDNISEAINLFFIVLSSFVVITYITPWFVTALFLLSILYYLIQLYYMPSARQAHRMHSVTMAPLFNNFIETLHGLVLIRAFKEQEYFQRVNGILLDRNTKFRFIELSSLRWLSVRIDILGNLFVFASVLFVITGRDCLSLSKMGLSVAYALQITEALNWLIKKYSILETNAVSIERIHEYMKIPSEAQWNNNISIPLNWPSVGDIIFSNYNLRYRQDLPLVLKDINIHIKGGDKVGVVGRTGAGKSSLNWAFFRLVEASSGKLIIDGIDISTIGIHTLRQNISILPQEPIIFSGTVRDNLDPLDKNSDFDLYQCLEAAHLSNWIASVSGGINYECGEDGANLSIGQKQLLCLARAILRKSKILILDEATSAVDMETDRLLMNTIKSHFPSSTVLIIAHRIETVLDADKIIVIDNGEVTEMNSPLKLLATPNSRFKSLYSHS